MMRGKVKSRGKIFPLTSPEDSEGGWNVSLLWFSAQLRPQGYQLYAPAQLYSQRESLVLSSVELWVGRSVTECVKTEWVTWTFSITVPGIEYQSCGSKPQQTAPTFHDVRSFGKYGIFLGVVFTSPYFVGRLSFTPLPVWSVGILGCVNS